MKTPSSVKPPRLAVKLFEWYCSSLQAEDMQGDMEELFYADLQRMSASMAKIKYWQHVVSLLFSYALRKRKQQSAFHAHSYTPIHPVMIANYFKIASRIISKNKTYSFINVLGLALGISACLMIYTITSHELSFDTFHPDRDRIYRVVMEDEIEGKKWLGSSVPAPVPAAVREELSGIEAVTGFHFYNPKISVPDGDKAPAKFQAAERQVVLTDPQYFSVFKYQWLAGNPSSLEEPFKVVLSERKARDYFGSISVDKILGKEIIYDDSLVAIVTGVVRDWNENTDFPMTDFISISTISNSFLKHRILLGNWGIRMHASQAFVKLGKGKSQPEFGMQLMAFAKKHDVNVEDGKKSTFQLKLQPLSDIHFNANYELSPSLLPTLYAMMGLALFILIIAVINFINLSTAQSLRRTKEIGIRKVLGGLRAGLIFQFLTETFLLTLSAICIAVLLVNPLLLEFSSFVSYGVHFDPFNPSTLLFLFAMATGTSILAGSYPAHVLTSHLPSVNLKNIGAQKGGSKWFLRKGLIVFQFSISLFFIIGTLVIGSQVNFIRSKNKGFETRNVVVFRTPWGDQSNKPKILAEKIEHVVGVDKVMVQSSSPMGFALMISTFVYKGKTVTDMGASIKSAGAGYIPFYQIHLLAGRNVVESDSLKEIVINQKYSEALGFKKPEEAVGELLYYEGKPHPIVGVVNNFHERSFHDPIGPCVIGNFPLSFHSVAIKISSDENNADSKKAVLAQVEKFFKEIYPEESFRSNFIDEEISWMHDRERKTATLMNVAMVVTIFISCMGVFGLALFTAETRTKEIGIRKVLGASVAGIVAMLSKDFMILIGIAILIASPISWYFINEWLQEFAYHVDITIGVYFVAGITALTIGLLSVSFQTIKAALANPVDSLKTE
jgi:putative ABC transport system permease protein